MGGVGCCDSCVMTQLTYVFHTVLCLQTQAIKRHEVYQVRKITERRKDAAGEWEYLVEWTSYDDVTWESAETLRHGALAILTAFNQRLSKPNKGKPTSKRKRTE